jgi:hypothetical protein
LGLELVTFPWGAPPPQDLASLEGRAAAREQTRFADARRQALQVLFIAALVTAAFVVILLVTANDLARAAEGRIEDRRVGGPA